MSEWKDIETAPLDTWILIYVPDREDCNLRIGIWSSKTNMNDYKPTHWMPLPPLPKKKHHCENPYMRCYTDSPNYDVLFLQTRKEIKEHVVTFCPICGEKV